MTVYAADFGPDAIAATAGLTEYSAAGAVTVARTTSGIVHIGNGFFLRDFSPNASTAALVWDAGGLYASEPIYPASGGGGGLDAAGVRAAIGLASANLDTQLYGLPTAAEIRAEIDANSTKLDATVSSRLATAGYTSPPSAASNATAVRSELAPELGRIDASVSSRESAASAAIDTADVLSAIGAVPTATEIRDELDAYATFASNIASAAGRLTGITSLANWLRATLRADAADATALSEINAGGGTYDEAQSSQEAYSGDVGMILSAVNNITTTTSQVTTSLRDMVQASSGDSWIEVEVIVKDTNGNKFDPADITDPGAGPRAYNGVGAIFEDEDGNGVVMYGADHSALATVGMCHHTTQANKPQIFERVSDGIYHFYVNRTATGDALPLGQLRMNLSFFNIAQADATYGASHINDTTPSSHIILPYYVNVTADTASIEAQIAALGSPMQASSYIAPDNAGITAIASAVGDIPTATENAAAVRAELVSELGMIDVAISTRQATSDADTKQTAVLSAIDAVPTAAENASALLSTEL